MVLVPASLFISIPLPGILPVFVLALLVILQCGFVGALIYYPYRSSAGPGPNVRSAEEPERTEYEQLCADHEAPVRGVWITDDLRDAHGFAQVFGLVPGNRQLFLDAEFFDLYGTAERRAVVVQEATLADRYYDFFEKAYVILATLIHFVIARLLVDTSVGARWPFIPEVLGMVLAVAGVQYARRSVYAADRSAAEHTDPETVSSALEKLAAKKAESRRETLEMKFFSLFWTRPSPNKRIERLRERFDLGASPPRE
jgi:hypothetical protein